jgi:hypothetical protein
MSGSATCVWRKADPIEGDMVTDRVRLSSRLVMAAAAAVLFTTLLGGVSGRDLVLFLGPLCLVSIALLVVRGRVLQFDGDLYLVTGPPGAGLPEEFFRRIHGLLRPSLRRLLQGQPWVSLELVGGAGQIAIQIWIPRREHLYVESLLQASYPGVVLSSLPERDIRGRASAAGHGRLAKSPYLPIRCAFSGEPLAGLLWTLARVPRGSALTIQLLVRPRPGGWRREAERQAQRLRDRRRLDKSLFRPSRVLGPTQTDVERAKAIEQKAQNYLGFDCVLRVTAQADGGKEARELVRSAAAGLRSFAAENSLDLRSVYVFGRRFGHQMQRRQFPLSGSFLLTPPELAGLWHVPSEAPPQLEIVRSPKLPAPLGAERGERVLGHSTWPDEGRPVGLRVADSRYHLHLLGSTGTGKTTAMLNLAVQDIYAGRGVGVLDPKGDLVRELLGRIPRERVNDVVLISPDDTGRSVGINPLELWPGDDRDLVADNALTIFKRIYERYWGPRTDDVLRSALLTLLRRPNSTLAHVPLLLTNTAVRRRMLRDLHDPLGLDGFWAQFNKLSAAQRGEAIGPVLNKLRDFLVRPRLRQILCQPHSTVDLREVVDSRKILLADLSVGRWGETTAALIGSFLVARIWQAVLARSKVEEERRRDFFLFVDEFQHFLGIAGPFGDVLAEARSLRLSLTIANQHLGQLTRDLREAVASNARSRVVFQCGQDDARYLAGEFEPLDSTALMSLARFETAARLCIDGRSSQAFTLRMQLPSHNPDPIRAIEVRAAAQRFSPPVELIDRQLQAAIDPNASREGDEGGSTKRP